MLLQVSTTYYKEASQETRFIKNNKIGWTVVMWLIKTNDN